MSTYSLTLRQDVGRKLTITELDGNFLYLQDTAFNASGNLPDTFVSIGDGLGNPATGSELFTFDSTCKNLIVGDGHTKNDTDNGVIIGGYSNTLDGDGEGLFNSSIIGGQYNKICYRSDESSIIGGYENCINYYSCRSSILGGRCNCVIDNSRESTIIGGAYNKICNDSCCSSIMGGCYNTAVLL